MLVGLDRIIITHRQCTLFLYGRIDSDDSRHIHFVNVSIAPMLANQERLRNYILLTILMYSLL